MFDHLSRPDIDRMGYSLLGYSHVNLQTFKLGFRESELNLTGSCHVIRLLATTCTGKRDTIEGNF